MRESGDRTFDLAAEEFTRALIALRSNQADSAKARFGRLANDTEPLGDWSRYFAATSAANLGDTAAVRAQLAQTAPDLRAQFGWRVRALALERAGDLRRAARTADSVAAAAKSERTRAIAYALAGRLHLQLHDSAQARKAFFAAANESARSSAAREAADHLAAFRSLSAKELRVLARVAAGQGRSTAALRYYRQARSRMPAGTERNELLLETARMLFAQQQHATMTTELKPLTKGNGAYAGQALLLIGRAELRDGNTKTALRLLQRVLTSKAGTQTRATAAFLAGDIAQDDGNLKMSDRYFRQVIEMTPHSEAAAEAYMRRGGAAFARNDFKKAAEIFAAYAARETGDARTQGKYWLARSLAKTGKATESRALLAAISRDQPYSYYAVLARRVTGESAAAPAAGPQSSAEVKRAAATFARVERLLRELDLQEEATYQAQRALDASRQANGGLHAYAEAVQELGGTAAGIRTGQQMLAEGKWDSRLLRIVYPFPYHGVIARAARRNGLAPDFVAAFIRQESLFEPRARSRVGALGLMQLMPATARAIDPHVDEEDLFDPAINVRIGTAHLRALLAEYGGHTERLIAAYNAGGSPVARWAKFPESRDPELFVERIPYDETRDYVKIVQRNAWLYSWLYGE